MCWKHWGLSYGTTWTEPQCTHTREDDEKEVEDDDDDDDDEDDDEDDSDDNDEDKEDGGGDDEDEDDNNDIGKDYDEDDDGDDDDGNDLDMCIFQRYHIQRNQTAVDLNARNILYICSCVRCVRGTVSVCERVSCVLVCMCVCVCARRCLCVCMDDESTAHLVGDGCDGQKLNGHADE